MSGQVEPIIEKLKLGVTRRYLIAVGIITVLSVAAYWVLNSTLKGADEVAYVVNVSGKQRMLSQTIALDAHRLVLLRQQLDEAATNSVSAQMQNSLQVIVQRLSNNIDEMALANQRLASGNLSGAPIAGAAPQILSQHLYGLYFGDGRLSDDVQHYLHLAKQIVAANNAPKELLNQLDVLSPRLLGKLDQAVKLYQLEGEQHLGEIKQLEAWVWLFTLLVLLMEARFIFSPMLSRVYGLSVENEIHLQNLEQKVAQRAQQLTEANAKLHAKANHDYLTGLYNRLKLEQDLEQVLQHQDATQHDFAVMMMDVDFFRRVNASLGMAAGDDVLVAIAKRIQKSVGVAGKVYRLGGEEFIVLMRYCHLNTAQTFAEAVRQDIEAEAFMSYESDVSSTISIGLYHSSMGRVNDIRQLMQCLDKALRYSKAQGKNRISLVTGLSGID